MSYDIGQYFGYLVKGQLREAFSYLKMYPKQSELVSKYENHFESKLPIRRSDNEVVNTVDAIYQDYYKDVFWKLVDKDMACKDLHENLKKFCDQDNDLTSLELIEDKVKTIINREGFEFLGGRTAGYYGPYIWKNTTLNQYDVELPTGVEKYSVKMMEGFVSTSWLDFISFEQVSTGGWSGNDGLIYCIKSQYNQDSPEFRIAFLKHEAQHELDKRLYKDIEGAELEYRAKLVELYYWPDNEKLRLIYNEADQSDKSNTHSYASYKIINAISQKLLGKEFEEDVENLISEVSNNKEIFIELMHASSLELTQQRRN